MDFNSLFSPLLPPNIIILDAHNNARSPHKDNNGSIENEELRGFLKDLLELAKKVRGGNLSAKRTQLSAKIDEALSQKLTTFFSPPRRSESSS
jgi:hypothetical protein